MEFPEHMFNGSGVDAVGGGGNSNMVKEYKSKNINAERRRRAKLKDSHHALRSLVPIITKMSKEATLTDATDYIRKLQEEIRRLEEELRETLPEDENEENREEEEDEDKKMDVKGEVDVIPISRNGFYVKMVCMMSKCRGFSKVVETLGSIGGEMTNVSFNAMDGVCQIMFCLEVEENKRNLKVEKDDVKFLLEKMV